MANYDPSYASFWGTPNKKRKFTASETNLDVYHYFTTILIYYYYLSENSTVQTTFTGNSSNFAL